MWGRGIGGHGGGDLDGQGLLYHCLKYIQLYNFYFMHTPILNITFKRQNIFSFNCHDLNIKYYNNRKLLLFNEDLIFINHVLTGTCRSML